MSQFSSFFFKDVMPEAEDVTMVLNETTPEKGSFFGMFSSNKKEIAVEVDGSSSTSSSE